jgi:hypothetical protein
MKNTRNIFTIILLALIMTGTFATSFAQDTEEAEPEKDSKKISGGYGYFTPGFGMYDVDKLNGFVGGTGDAFQGAGLTFGGGGMVMVRSLILGGEGSSFLKQKATIGDQDVAFETGWGKGYLGYVLMGKKGFLLYPKVGIGAYKHVLTLNDNSSTTSVLSVYNGQYSATQLVRKGMLLSFGAGFEWMPGFDEAAGSGIVIGLEAGYNLAATQNNWEAYGKSLVGGPFVNPSGVYVQLHVGFGGWNRQ